MPAALEHLKKHKHGLPNEVFPKQHMDKNGNPSKTGWKIATRRWDKIMDQIIAGFEASARVKEGLYEKELGPYPGRRPKDKTKEEWRAIRDERFKKSQKLAKRDEKIFKKGMKLFGEWYWNLWD